MKLFWKFGQGTYDFLCEAMEVVKNFPETTEKTVIFCCNECGEERNRWEKQCPQCGHIWRP